jgi:hypothetical protein
MPRYKLRTLLIVLAVGPPLIAFGWFWTTQPDFGGIWRPLIGMIAFALACLVIGCGQWDGKRD